jgi:SAM-dependent methyltransferase
VNALERWRDELGGWAIPEEILANAPESPWGFPPELFLRRSKRARADPTTTTRRALEALGERGDVLDVGVGAGATSLPLARRASLITGVDESADMLEGFLGSAREAGVEAAGVQGRWPDVSSDVEPADVVVCGHVLYNVGGLEPFVRALDDHARRRVVLEITSTHPLAWTADLWVRFHGLELPSGPSSDVAFEAIEQLGVEVRRDDEARAPRSGDFERREDAVALVRRRLCLPAERDDEIADALGDRLAERDGLWTAGPAEHTLTTLWWDRR